MKTIIGKVIKVEIGVPVKKKDGGTYDAWRLTYNDSDGAVAQIAKPVGGLKFQPALKAALESLSPDDEFTVEMEKNDKGYLDVTSVRKGVDMPTPTTFTRKDYKTDKSGNWETSEERAKRQVHITRQSSLDRAVQLSGLRGKLDTKDVLKLAETFETWVLRETPPAEAPEVE
jgi:hypothetical protein